MDKLISTLFAGVIAVVAILLLLFYSAFSWGFVVFYCYKWYLMPIFHLPTITVYQAVGLGVIRSLISINDSHKTGDGVDLQTFILHPWIFLLTAYIISFIVL